MLMSFAMSRPRSLTNCFLQPHPKQDKSDLIILSNQIVNHTQHDVLLHTWSSTISRSSTCTAGEVARRTLWSYTRTTIRSSPLRVLDPSRKHLRRDGYARGFWRIYLMYILSFEWSVYTLTLVESRCSRITLQKSKCMRLFIDGSWHYRSVDDQWHIC